VHTGFWWGNLRKRPLERPRRRWEDSIKMELRELGWESTDWIDLAQDMNRWRVLVNKPSGSIKCGEFLDWLMIC
jgi:hypothetical protein